MLFLDELISALGLRPKRKEHDQQPLESPAKRSRLEAKAQHQQDPLQRTKFQPSLARGAGDAMAPVLSQQQQAPVLQQQPVQPQQKPEWHKSSDKVLNRRGEQLNNAFKQLEDGQRSPATALAGAGLPRRKGYFSQGLAMQPQLGSSTPVIGWRSSSTPQQGLYSQHRLQSIANSRQWRERHQSQHRHQQHSAIKPEPVGGAAAAVFGEMILGDTLTPDPKQRLFEAADTAPRTSAMPAAALAPQGAMRAAGQPTSIANNVAAAAVLRPAGLFTQLLHSTASGVGFVMNGPVSSIPGSSVPSSDTMAPLLVSPAAAAAARGPTAPAAPPAVLNSPSAGFALASVSALQSQDTSQQERAIAELQQKFNKLREQGQVLHRDVNYLQSQNCRVLGLSPEYQPSNDPAAKQAMQELLQQGQLKQQQRLRREAELVQQRSLHIPAAAAAGPELQRAGRSAATAGQPAGKTGQQQEAAGEDNEEVICLTSGDEDDNEQQQDDDSAAEEEHSGEYDDEAEEGSEEGSAEYSEDEAAAAGVEALHLHETWLGPRTDWTPTRQQLARYESSTKGPGPDSELLTHHQRACIELRREHMACLRPGEWLNDEVINMYIAMLQDRDTALRSMPGCGAPRCHFFSTFFLNKLYKDARKYNYENVRRWSTPKKLQLSGQKSECLLDVDRIIMPVHQDVHWTAAMVDLVGKRFVFFDSMLGKNPLALDALKRWLADEAMNKRQEVWDTASWPALFPQDIPRQHNSCDCGVFALLFCNRLGLRQPFDFAQADLLINARVRVCCELLDGRLPLPGKLHHT